MKGCCCRQQTDNKEKCKKVNNKKVCKKVNEKGRKGKKTESSPKKEKRKVSFTMTDEPHDDHYDADTEVREYDLRQIRMASHDHKEDIAKSHQHLAEQVYYPPLERGHSRLPLQEQRAEAVRLQSLVKNEIPKPNARKSLLDRSHDVGEVFTRESIQKQQLYSFLVAAEPHGH